MSCEQSRTPFNPKYERVMPSFRSDGSSINALQSKWNKGNGGGSRLSLEFGKGVSFFYSEQQQQQQKNRCLCVVQEVLHSLMPFQ